MTNTVPAPKKNSNYAVLISLVATIGGFLFGFDSGVINGTVDGLVIAFGSSDVATGFNVASMLLGCAIGAALAGWLSDRFGRRAMLIVAAICFLVSAWGSGVADSSLVFVVFRILGGLGVGAASVMAPAYISEIAPAAIRGRLATLQQVAIITGLFIAFLSNYLIAGAAGAAVNDWLFGISAWRWMFWIELIPASIFFIALFSIPESPRFMVANGRVQDAQITLSRLTSADTAQYRIAEIHKSLASDHKPQFRDAFSSKTLLKRVIWIGIGLAIFQQLVGINVIFYYGAVLWQAAGFSEGSALLQNVLSGGLSIAAVILGLLFVDKIGRKPLLLIGSIGMSVTLVLLAYAFSTGTAWFAGDIVPAGTMFANGRVFEVETEIVANIVDLTPSMGQLALISALIYVVFFNLSWGPVMWVMLGEMFPNQVRGSGLAISGFFQWLANFAITLTFPIMLSVRSIGLAGAYGFYAFCAIVSVLFVILFIYETRGSELEDMSE